jgi:hypothetical protein
MQHLKSFRGFENAIVSCELIKRAIKGAFRAGAVVAAYIDDQRVIEFAMFSTSWMTRPISLSV